MIEIPKVPELFGNSRITNEFKEICAGNLQRNLCWRNTKTPKAISGYNTTFQMVCFCNSLPIPLWYKLFQFLKENKNDDVINLTVSLCACDSLQFLLSTSLNHPLTPYDKRFDTLSEIRDYLLSNPPKNNRVRDIVNSLCGFLLNMDAEHQAIRIAKFKELYSTAKLDICCDGETAKTQDQEKMSENIRKSINELETNKGEELNDHGSYEPLNEDDQLPAVRIQDKIGNHSVKGMWLNFKVKRHSFGI
jgi:hypothetical protein